MDLPYPSMGVKRWFDFCQEFYDTYRKRIMRHLRSVMSSGLGKRCRQVLNLVDAHPGKWVRIYSQSRDASVASSLRRAAHTLERRGLVETKKHHDSRGTWLVVRRKSEDPVPADLARILGPERLKSLLSVYGVCSSEQWQRKIDNARDFLKDELWQCFLDSGLSIDKAKSAMTMMKAGMFYSANGQSQADQLKAMIDSLKESIGRS